ncbi:MAG: DUF2063 domain-containing protein [Deltaproteobacteria bacterium]|nr:DUF2063 domain-containing protein [Deltaproteobacteria bacterium]
MRLEEQQAAIERICFRRQPPDADLDAVGERERWLIYRRMVRGRLERLCRVALPRSLQAAGDERFDAWLAAWLAERAPRTRYFWRVVAEFVDFTLEGAEVAPSWLAELMRYEAVRWHTRYDEAAPEDEVLALDFERVPYVNPTLTLLDFDHPVHQLLPQTGDSYTEASTQLAVFRRGDEETVTWTLNPMGAALVTRWQLEGESLRESVVKVTTERSATLDARFLESLAGLLEGLLERGLLLGSRG